MDYGKQKQETKLLLPTEAELEILNVLWDLGPSTVREVHDILSKKRDTVYTTVLKQMQTMLEKGLVLRNERFRSHLYESRYGMDQIQGELAADLMRRAFRGSVKSLVLGALSGRRTSKKELAEIRQLLEQFESEER
jgi:BlaI family penicillinase repressor